VTGLRRALQGWPKRAHPNRCSHSALLEMCLKTQPQILNEPHSFNSSLHPNLTPVYSGNILMPTSSSNGFSSQDASVNALAQKNALAYLNEIREAIIHDDLETAVRVYFFEIQKKNESSKELITNQ